MIIYTRVHIHTTGVNHNMWGNYLFGEGLYSLSVIDLLPKICVATATKTLVYCGEIFYNCKVIVVFTPIIETLCTFPYMEISLKT